ncbi:MAG: amino acid permease [Candidatus Planktophila sp.]|nr:amino acid permease [Candidatus Planktophila sp.]
MPKSWTDGAPAPVPLQEHVHLKDPFFYRVKNRLLGKPINRHSLHEQRLSKRHAYGVLSSDCISSSAYGGEQILVALIPAFGLAAFTIFTPLIGVILIMLLIITFSYRDVINTYTRAGGAYVVARENFGKVISQIAAIELIFGYIITVAIQTAAGVAAIISAVPELTEYKVVLTILVIALLAYINLRGIKDAGLIFVLPSYLFLVGMFTVFIFGLYRNFTGTLPEYPTDSPGLLPLGEPQGLLSLAAILLILKAFANGSASLTGLEAISDSVALFKEPEHNNARKTLMLMSATLGALIVGIAWLAHQVLAIPYASGTPTVISLVAQASLGNSLFGESFYYFVQAATTFILFAGANTCFNAFPNMVNIVANDGFLPNQLTKRGHRLAFSNGIILISSFAIILVIVSKASITTLAAIYALAVFIGFALTGFGMAKKNRNNKGKYYLHLTTGVIAITTVLLLSVLKFAEGTWLVVIGTPIVAAIMLRFNQRYGQENKALILSSKDSRATSITRHNVTVLVDRIDIATVGAIRYARSLKPRNINAVHFVIDDRRAEELSKGWRESPVFADISLDLIDCPDRRLVNSIVDYAQTVTAAGDVELTLLLPHRAYSKFLGRLLHDQTTESIAGPISQIPRVVAIIIPFDVQKIIAGQESEIHSHTVEAISAVEPKQTQSTFTKTPINTASKSSEPVSHYVENMTPIGEITWRSRAHVQGQVTSIRTAPSGTAPWVEVEVWDETGGVTLQFLGRRKIAGLKVGSQMRAEGMVGEEEGSMVILNPSYELLV